MAPQNAFLFLQGIETLSLRAERHMENAEKLSQWLTKQSNVVSVHHPSLPSSPYYARAQKDFPKGAGSIVTFELEGGRDAGKAFLNNVKLASRLVNLGDAKTSVTHPASTTHSQLDEAGLKAAGVGAGMVRVSVGIEHIDDILEDFAQALEKAKQPVTA
jgi:O-acetylhomoserine (thiol)-lyase